MAKKASTFGVNRIIKKDEQETRLLRQEARREEIKFSEYAAETIKKQGFIPTY